MKKIVALMFAILLLISQGLVFAEDSDQVRTVTKTVKKVTVESPLVIKGNKAVNDKINSKISSIVEDFASEANDLGGGKVHYDLHKCDDSIISLTIVMSPQNGVEESRGLTFERSTGALRPLSFYYNDSETLSRAADGLKYLYDVDPNKVKSAPDEYYVDSDSNVIGIYHAGAILDKNEGEIEVNLSAADPVIVKEPETAPPVYTGSGNKGTITGTEVRMRSGAGTDTDILGYFEKGEVVEVLQSDVVNGTKWYKVTRTSGSTGWVAADYCSLAEGTKVESAAKTEKTGRIVGTEVRMRSEPNLNADVLDYFTNGEEVVILDAASGSELNWTKVRRANGTIGWVSSAYCKENKD